MEWAIHGWWGADESKRLGYYEVVAMLVRAGAMPDLQWFANVENRQPAAKKIQSDPRMLAALPGDRLSI